MIVSKNPLPLRRCLCEKRFKLFRFVGSTSRQFLEGRETLIGPSSWETWNESSVCWHVALFPVSLNWLSYCLQFCCVTKPKFSWIVSVFPSLVDRQPPGPHTHTDLKLFSSPSSHVTPRHHPSFMLLFLLQSQEETSCGDQAGVLGTKWWLRAIEPVQTARGSGAGETSTSKV